MKSRRELDGPRKLRVPAALAVAFVGSSTMVSIWYGGCSPQLPDPTPDAGEIEKIRDADVLVDAGPDDQIVLVDAGIDAPPDADDTPH